jgi:hypothetical protein
MYAMTSYMGRTLNLRRRTLFRTSGNAIAFWSAGLQRSIHHALDFEQKRRPLVRRFQVRWKCGTANL